MPPTPTPDPFTDGAIYLTDGGIETTLIYGEGIDLVDFAAFPLLEDPAGREVLTSYYESYLAVADRDRVGIVLETATWRASADWAGRLGWDADRLRRVNAASVALVADLRARLHTDAPPLLVSGCVGPRGDGYQVGQVMAPAEARAYHGLQAEAFAAAGADLMTGITMTTAAEATGVAEAARSVGLPVVLAFTVETDGVLPSGQALGDAIAEVDAATGGYPVHYMVNCAHPTHFAHLFAAEPTWAGRLGGIRANASKASHAELDEAEELDAGDPDELAADYRALRDRIPSLRVFGGCCGTDHRHIDAISTALVPPVRAAG